MLKVVCAILITFFISVGAFGQEHYLGFNYGKKLINMDFPLSNYNSFGIKYQIKNSEIKTETYIEEVFENIKDNGLQLHYLKTTIGANLNFGKQLYFIIGVGINARLLIINKDYLYNSKLKKIALGGRFNIGTGYFILPQFSVEFLYQYHVGITPIYISNNSTAGGAKFQESVYGSVNLIQISVAYLIKSK